MRLTVLLGLLAGLLPVTAFAAGTPGCGAAYMSRYAQPGRVGGSGDNAFVPLPEVSPARPGGEDTNGTLGLSLHMVHVNKPTQTAGWVYLGNYRVTDLPVLRTELMPGTTAFLGGLPLPAACLVNPAFAYAGTQWDLLQGDTMDSFFFSELDYSGPNAVELPSNGAVPCRSSNLHVHGLLISPYHPARAGLGPYGDYVLDVTQPRGSLGANAETDDCDTDLQSMLHHGHGLTNLPLHYVSHIPGTPHESGLGAGEHPSGLFWYHPHAHGFSRQQVAGGTTGVITVGDLDDYACKGGEDCATGNVRVLELKDAQISRIGPDMWSFIHGGDGNVHDYDPALCAPAGANRNGECNAADHSSKWVFTINGIQFPLISALAGKREIWRIVNASPNMTYRLRLVNTVTGAALPVQLLAKDGVGISQSRNAPVLRQEALMMPASRLEIAISPPPGGGTYVLENRPVITGANDGGDTWPAIRLAQVTWPTQTATAAAAVAPTSVAAPKGVTMTAARAWNDSAGLPPECIMHAGDSRVIYFVHRFNQLNNEVFGLLAGVRRQDGTLDFFNDEKSGEVLHSAHAVWERLVNGKDAAAPAFGHNPFSTVCTVKGNVESWELQNWSSENHNFHIHQTRFTLDPNGAFAFPLYEPGEPAALAQTDADIRAFADLAVPSYNDTVPVPRGQSFCAIYPALPGCALQDPDDNLECTGEPGALRCANPGKITVLLNFSRPEQVGSFVYHCHILEHEDGGMMAHVHVMCAPNDPTCAAQAIAAAPICRPHPG